MISLENRLRQKVTLLHSREAEIEQREIGVSARAEEINRTQSFGAAEIESKLRLLRQEMTDQITLEKEKSARLEERSKELEEETNEWKSRYARIETEFVDYRRSQIEMANSNPVEQLSDQDIQCVIFSDCGNKTRGQSARPRLGRGE